ncbi:MAG: hypothetical protein FGM23_06340 [Alphaproteobacteria bacterium]|nr:hypothetical protein [Alphaproteobacteria bacterium]
MEKSFVEKYAFAPIGELVETFYQIDSKLRDAALKLQAALIVADEKVPGEQAKKVWDRVRPLAQVKADILSAGITEDQYNEDVAAKLAELGSQSAPDQVPPMGMLLTKPNAGLVDGGGAVLSQDALNPILAYQAAARLLSKHVHFAKPRVDDRDPEPLKLAQQRLAENIQSNADAQQSGDTNFITDLNIALDAIRFANKYLESAPIKETAIAEVVVPYKAELLNVERQFVCSR